MTTTDIDNFKILVANMVTKFQREKAFLERDHASNLISNDEYEFRKKVLDKKIERLRSFVEVPCYLRYKYADDVEFQRELDKQVKDLDDSIKLLTDQLLDAETNLRLCQDLESKLDLSSAPGILAFKQNKKDMYEAIDKISQLKGQIGDISKKRDILKNMPLSKYRQELISKHIKNAAQIEALLSGMTVSPSGDLLSNLSVNPKVQLLSSLGDNYSLYEAVVRASNEYKSKQSALANIGPGSFSSRILESDKLPNSAKRMLTDPLVSEKDRNNPAETHVVDSSRLASEVSSYRTKMNEEETKFNGIYDRNDMLDLVGVGKRKYKAIPGVDKFDLSTLAISTNVNDSLIRKFNTILPKSVFSKHFDAYESIYAREQELIDTYNDCKWHEFAKKSACVKKIMNQDYNLDDIYSKCITSIKNWYLTQSFEKIGLSDISSVIKQDVLSASASVFANQASLDSFLNTLRTTIVDTRNAFDTTVNIMNNSVTNAMNARTNATNERDQALARLRALLPGISDDVLTNDHLLEIILQAVSKTTDASIVNDSVTEFNRIR